jgi:propionyl-CoA carboxylase alpha chain
MFKKILIANRGEIACRVVRTARQMGIATVAVYSDADKDAVHVNMADEAVRLGPAPSKESYLRGDTIIEACRASGAEALHPGYGFLSENASFAEALRDAGITFIGPDVKAITSMGDKITSKEIAARAGVNVIPGFSGVIENAEHAVAVARDIGYPVMLKASAGGGGKGMRIVKNDEDCRDGFERARNEARASFGDDRVFAEKFIEEPRHIEIQVVADQHGNTIYLGERECSIQRRHQKVLEEAPSPFLDEATRRAMGEQACALARAVDYCSAGTVEFIVDAERHFYFLEMNTRLQVEHPVTEMVTGLDLVELMIRVAAGEQIPIEQSAVTLNGWALEARVYAEDPYRDFLPSIGRLTRYQEPPHSGSVRVDTGIIEGSEVSMYYDPMIAKLVTHGADRRQALARMAEALDNYYIRGVAHNVPFLSAVIRHPRFVEGHLSTNFIAEEYPEGFGSQPCDATATRQFVAVAAVLNWIKQVRTLALSDQLSGHECRMEADRVVVIDGAHHEVSVKAVNGAYEVFVDDGVQRVELEWRPGQNLIPVKLNGAAMTFQAELNGVIYRLYRGGSNVEARVVKPRAAQLMKHIPDKPKPDLSRFLLSPMPGLLVKLAVEEGDSVRAGEELAVVEAMKMENSLRAAESVKVLKVLARCGESLSVDQPILEFDTADA